jgi:hypothetical protein
VGGKNEWQSHAVLKLFVNSKKLVKSIVKQMKSGDTNLLFQFFSELFVHSPPPRLRGS